MLAVVVLGAACGGDDEGGQAAEPSSAGGGGVASAPSTTAAADEASTDASSGDAGADECTADRVGGALTVGSWSETRSLDPVFSTGGLAGGTELAALYDTLLRYNPATNSYEGWLAESIEPNADASEWTLMLRPGITFGNGDPLDAAAVKASIERVLDPANKSRAFDSVAGITEILTPDELTVVFRLRGPEGAFPSALASTAGMITNPNVVAELGEDFKTMPTGGGAGPYEIVSWMPGERIVMKAKADYWAGPVCIQDLTFNVTTDDQARWLAFDAGDLQMTWMRDPEVIADVRATDDYNQDPAFTFVRGASGLLAINQDRPPLDDVRVRRAINLAIDAEAINQRGFGGEALATKSLIHPDSILHTDQQEPLAYDVDAAKDLVVDLKAGGWDGTVDLLCPQSAADIGLAIKTMLEIAGMTVSLDPSTTVADFIQRQQVLEDYELACQGANIDDTNPWAGLSRLASDSPANYYNVENPQLDGLLDDLRAATSLDAQKPILDAIQALWNDQVIGVVYYASEQFTVVSPQVHGVVPNIGSLAMLGRAYLAS